MGNYSLKEENEHEEGKIMRNRIFLGFLICMLVCVACNAQSTTTVYSATIQPSAFGRTLITPENAATIELLGTLAGHTDKVTSVEFSSDGAYIATSSRDQTIKLWDAHTWEELHTFDTGIGFVGINGIVFSPDSSSLITPWAIWDLDTYEEVTALNRSGLHVAVSPDGRLVAVSSESQEIQLWDVASGEIVRTFETPFGEATFSIVFSPDGALLAAADGHGMVRMWDVAGGELVMTFEYGDDSDVHDLAFSPDGAWLATGGTAQSMRLWDVASGQMVRSTGAEGVMGLTFSPDGKLVAAESMYTVKLWDVASGDVVANLRHPAELLSVAFSPDGSLIASGGYDGNVYLWGIPQQ